MTPKQERYVNLYVDALSANFAWAQDETKLANARKTIVSCIEKKMNGWQIDGLAGMAAWRGIGGKGKPTFKVIHNL